jgi:hypothetical protein
MDRQPRQTALFATGREKAGRRPLRRHDNAFRMPVRQLDAHAAYVVPLGHKRFLLTGCLRPVRGILGHSDTASAAQPRPAIPLRGKAGGFSRRSL